MLQLQNDFSKNITSQSDMYISGKKLSTLQLGEKLKRRNKACIKNIQHNGNTLQNPTEIKQCITDYFETFFTPTPEVNNDFIPVNVISENNPINEQMMNDITDAKIFRAIKENSSKKTPGPDGLPKSFI
jgi:hypothetical protein